MNDPQKKPVVGLCENCRHVRVVESPRGSVFFMCRRSEVDSRYAKYPALPVWTCVGYEAKPNQAAPETA